VEVAVSEAVTNSVVHGSPSGSDGAVLIKCRADGERLEVEIEDNSHAQSLPDPAHCDPDTERGRGVLMMHTLMDEFEDSRTEYGIRIRMSKQMTPAGCLGA